MIVRVVIAGGRDFNDFDLLVQECDYLLSRLSKEYTIIIVSGKARGADELGEKYAKLRGYNIDSHPADWSLGKQAGYLRNIEMAKSAGYLIAFHDGVSKGTGHMINIAKQYGLKIRVINY